MKENRIAYTPELSAFMQGCIAPVIEKRPRRILMHFIDAGPGEPNWARFECKKCLFQKETHTATNADLARGIPCPHCNKP